MENRDTTLRGSTLAATKEVPLQAPVEQILFCELSGREARTVNGNEIDALGAHTWCTRSGHPLGAHIQGTQHGHTRTPLQPLWTPTRSTQSGHPLESRTRDALRQHFPAGHETARHGSDFDEHFLLRTNSLARSQRAPANRGHISPERMPRVRATGVRSVRPGMGARSGLPDWVPGVGAPCAPKCAQGAPSAWPGSAECVSPMMVRCPTTSVFLPRHIFKLHSDLIHPSITRFRPLYCTKQDALLDVFVIPTQGPCASSQSRCNIVGSYPKGNVEHQLDPCLPVPRCFWICAEATVCRWPDVTRDLPRCSTPTCPCAKYHDQ